MQNETTRLFMAQITAEERVSESEKRGQWKNFIKVLQRKRDALAMDCAKLESRTETYERDIKDVKRQMAKDYAEALHLQGKEDTLNDGERARFWGEATAHVINLAGRAMGLWK
jgi:chromosome segregation ATPase